MLRSLQSVIELSGIQASGKTTLAKQLLSKAQGTARVNKDDLRQMLRGDAYTLKDEKLVVAVEKAAAQAIIDNGYSLIVDDTNLSKDNHWSSTAKRLGLKYQAKRLDVSVDEAIHRDSLRENPVGVVAIRTMAKRLK